MGKSNKKKQDQLGMPVGTATAKLRKAVLFYLVQQLNLDYCYQCKKKIEKEEEFSIEHKIPYLDSTNPKELFFSLTNIAFSHLSCNCRAGRRKTGLKHPSQESYRRGCRCEGCKDIQKYRRRLQRKKGIKT